VNIYEKLIEVRKAVPYLQKTNAGAQYKYVGSSDVLGAIRKSMDDHKLMVIPRVLRTNVITSEGENSRGGKNTKYFTETQLEYTVVNAEKPDEAIVIPWYAQGLDTEGEKGVGKALTYGEKYLFLKLFNIATDIDDPDAFQRENGRETGKPKAAPKPAPTPAAPPKPPAANGPASNSANAAKPIEQPKPATADGQPPDWKAFWQGARALNLAKGATEEKAFIHREASSFFNCTVKESLNDVPDLDNAMLQQFLEYLRTLAQQAS
jgi:hypothetical protein